jgi:hypothetical protein
MLLTVPILLRVEGGQWASMGGGGGEEDHEGHPTPLEFENLKICSV